MRPQPLAVVPPGLQLQIETVAHCQARCTWCPYPGMSRPKGVMDQDLYARIIAEAATLEPIKQVCLTGLGEPLLDRHLLSRVRLALATMPGGTFVDLFTNGSMLTPDRFVALRDAGISCVSISLNAVNAEQRDETMGLRDFDRVCSYIDFAIQNRGETFILVKAVLDGQVFTLDDCPTFYRRWGRRGMGGHGQVVSLGNWAGEYGTDRTLDPASCCDRAIGQIYVTWDGRVTTCCFDPDGKQVFGDLKLQTIREVYNGPEYVRFREAHAENRADQYEMCRNCTRI